MTSSDKTIAKELKSREKEEIDSISPPKEITDHIPTQKELVPRRTFDNDVVLAKMNGMDIEKEKRKPRSEKEKCRFSPFAYHRFARSHKEKCRDGSILMILRCRYCFEMQQVILRFELKDGRYIAIKETVPVEEKVIDSQ